MSLKTITQIQIEIVRKQKTIILVTGLISSSTNVETRNKNSIYELEVRSNDKQSILLQGMNLELLKQNLVLELQKIVDQYYNPNQDRLMVIKDNMGLFALNSGYCQHCKKKIVEYYGFCHGVIKKCNHCKKLTTIKNDEWKKHWDQILSKDD